MSTPASTSPGPRYDVIVVLGGPLPAMRRRTAHGVRLFEAGLSERMLMCGAGRKRGNRLEAEIMAEQAREAGVPGDRIFLEDRSRSTLENAMFSARVMADRGWRTALVVTDPLHLPRALIAFRAAGVKARGGAAWTGWRRELLRTWPAEILYEAVALVWYIGRILAGKMRRGRGRD